MSLAIQPIYFAEACELVRRHHRHHSPPVGHLFSLAVNDGEKVVGVAIVGRPVSRHRDDGWTAEVTRLCTDSTPHVASKLYAAARRAAFALGYRRIGTYILDTESGVSLRAAGWRLIGRAGGGSWNVQSRPRVDKAPTCQSNCGSLRRENERKTVSQKPSRKLILLLLLLTFAVPAHARELRGTVTKVRDGDSCTVCNKSRCEPVRLLAVDAPEKGQPHYAESGKMLAALVLNQAVRVVWKKRDGYGRLVGRIIVGRVDVNHEMLRAGGAWFWTSYARELSPRQRKRYAEAEAAARVARRGLWREDNPTEPWQFRKRKGTR